jgi:hypothetical protein
VVSLRKKYGRALLTHGFITNASLASDALRVFFVERYGATLITKEMTMDSNQPQTKPSYPSQQNNDQSTKPILVDDKSEEAKKADAAKKAEEAKRSEAARTGTNPSTVRPADTAKTGTA